MHIGLRCALVMIVGCLVSAGSAAGAVWTEVGDAGKLIGTAQETGVGPLTGITTDLSSSTDVDLFKLRVVGNGEVTFATSGPFDPQLFLFDANGKGIVANDNTGSGDGADPNARITATVTTGFYYLGFSLANVDPISSTGLIFPDLSTGLLGPTGPGGNDPLSGWQQSGQSIDALIAIEFIFAKIILVYGSQTTQVPEPSTLMLLSLGTALLTARTARRRRS